MKSPSWRSVSGGVIALTVLVASVVFVATYMRAGALRGDTFRLYVAVSDASNLLEGSDVWLNGRRVGTVKSIGFAPPSAPLDVRVIVGVDILADMRPQIRLDSPAALRTGGSFIGAPVVAIGSGTLSTRMVVPGDTLRAAGKSELEIVASRATETMEQLPALMADARQVMALTKAAGARYSGLLDADAGRGAFTENASALASRLSSGRGSAALIMRDTEIRARVTRSMASMDSLRTLLASRSAEFGRFRRDSSLATAVASLRAEVEVLRTMASAPTGTVGRFRTDSALRRGIDGVFLELDSLFADIKKNPMRYARVF